MLSTALISTLLDSNDESNSVSPGKSVLLVLTPHSPIKIEGDLDFAAQASSEGWPGNGSDTSPYVISSCLFANYGTDYPIWIANTTVYFEISNCTIRDFLRTGIQLRNITHATLSVNNITCGERSSGIYSDDSDNMTLSRNIVVVELGMGGSGPGVYLQRCENFTIDSNVITGGLSLGIDICKDCVVSNNTLWGKYDSLKVLSSLGGIYTGNDCSGGTGVSVHIQLSPGNVFSLNTFEGSGYAVWNEESDYCIYNNNTFNAGQRPLVLESSDFITVRGNLWNGTGGPSMADGLYLIQSQGNLIYENTFSRCFNYGVHIEDTASQGSIIWNNTFLYNHGSGDTYDPAHAQAYDFSGGNFWNSSDGYGNYWTDWQTPDNDPPYGIVDLPYNITGGAGAQDHYPLTNAPTPIPEFAALPLLALAIVGLFAATARGVRREG